MITMLSSMMMTIIKKRMSISIPGFCAADCSVHSHASLPCRVCRSKKVKVSRSDLPTVVSNSVQSRSPILWYALPIKARSLR